MSDQDLPEFQPPPPPDFPPAETPPDGPVMSIGETLTGIVFEPTKTYESLRARPRFLVAMIISIVAIMAFQVLFIQRIGYERITREAVENSPRAANLSADQKEQQIAMQNKPIVKAIGMVAPAIVIAVFFAVGAALYLLGSALMGGKLRYKQALSVWTYSGLPAIVVVMLLNILLLFIKSDDSYDVVMASRSGLVQANLSFLVDPKTSPAVYAILGSFDVFQFYGLFLAALGLRIVGKLSSGGAWGIVIALWLIGVVLKVAGSILFGAM